MSEREAELEAKLAEWIAYADKLKQIQAQDGLRIVKPATLGE